MSVRAEPHGVTLGLFDNPTSLIYGIGNDGRQDDGLGWAFIDRLEQIHPRPRACLRRTYQLGLEDADLISRYTRVLFVDATKDPAVESFNLSLPEPKLDFSFTSHAISVPSILATTQQCFDHVPEAYCWLSAATNGNSRLGLTSPAQHNLSQSVEFLSRPR